jgi:predicted metalloprotease
MKWQTGRRSENVEDRRGMRAGGVEEALNAAPAIGDDRPQREAQGHVVPESLTYGTSTQRVRWFERGLRSGDLESCNTFEARRP